MQHNVTWANLNDSPISPSNDRANSLTSAPVFISLETTPHPLAWTLQKQKTRGFSGAFAGWFGRVRDRARLTGDPDGIRNSFRNHSSQQGLTSNAISRRCKI